MSRKHYIKRTLREQNDDMATDYSPSQLVSHLWFSGDTCSPLKLPISELEGRRDAHLAQIGEMRPTHPDYDRQVAFTLLYELALQLA